MTADSRERALTRAARVIGVVICFVGALVLVAWGWHVELIKNLSPQFVTMKANTAVLFIACGILLTLPRADSTEKPVHLVPRIITSSLTGIIFLVGFVTLLEYLFGFDAHIDQLLFDDRFASQTSHPGRMAPATAVNFCLFSAGYWLLDARKGVIAQWFASIIFVSAYLGLMGYLYDVASLYRLGNFTSVALHTALLLMLLGLGLLFLRPAHGFMRVVTSDGINGILVRRLIPVAFLLPPIIDLLQLRVSGLGESAFVVAFVALINVIVLVALVWWTARSIGLSDRAREQAESEVHTSEARLGLALHASGGGVWDWNLTTGIAWWSPEMYELWGVPKNQEMNFANSVENILPSDRQAVQAKVEAAIADRHPYQTEFRIQHPTLDERWMSSRGDITYDSTGKAIRMVGITLDITEQKRVELLLRDSNYALTRSNIELQRFAHAASHDLQTPMRSVASFADLLRLKYSDKIDAQGRDWLHRIVQSITDLQLLVRNILNYSRVESQSQPFVATSMQQVVDRTLLLLDAAIREAGATIAVGSLPTIQGDATQLGELFLNLIGNALKYRSTRTPLIEISATHHDDEWLFSVRDNGIGIDSKYYARIFEIFQRLHTQQEISGSGIGLAICRRVVERHGGRIWVESKLGEGSTFFFTLRDTP